MPSTHRQPGEASTQGVGAGVCACQRPGQGEQHCPGAARPSLAVQGAHQGWRTSPARQRVCYKRLRRPGAAPAAPGRVQSCRQVTVGVGKTAQGEDAEVVERPAQRLDDRLSPSVELGLAQRLWLEGANAQLSKQAAHVRDAGLGGQGCTPGASGGVRHGVRHRILGAKGLCGGAEKWHSARKATPRVPAVMGDARPGPTRKRKWNEPVGSGGAPQQAAVRSSALQPDSLQRAHAAAAAAAAAVSARLAALQPVAAPSAPPAVPVAPSVEVVLETVDLCGLPAHARSLLTKKSTQEEVARITGAFISTKCVRAAVFT